jgi:hypothetical protein
MIGITDVVARGRRLGGMPEPDPDSDPDPGPREAPLHGDRPVKIDLTLGDHMLGTDYQRDQIATLTKEESSSKDKTSRQSWQLRK